MSLDFSDYIDAVSDDSPFETLPVSIEEFTQSDEFLHLPPLSKYQYTIIRASSQIYKKETLVEWLGEDEAEKRWRETKNEIVLQLGKGCHAPYTPVFNASTGQWQRLDSMSGGDNRVVSLTKEGKLKTSYATESFYEGTGPMYRVSTVLGRSEDVYEGHKYWSAKRGRFYHRNDHKRNTKVFEWRPVSELEPGDFIATAMGFDVETPVNILKEEALILGHLVGDGFVASTAINVCFNRDETGALQRYLDACAAIGEVPTRTITDPKKHMQRVVHSTLGPVGNLARRAGVTGKFAHNKVIPTEVWQSDNTILAAFISGLWSSDGACYSKLNRGGIGHPSLEYCSISEELAVGVQKALARLGVPAVIRNRIPVYTYKGEKLQGQRAYYVHVNNFEGVKAFASSGIELCDYKLRILQEGIIEKESWNTRTGRTLEGNVYWARITKKEYIGEGDYWTVNPPEHGNYVGDMAISSNSGKGLISSVACAYVVYLLMCLKDPAAYYGKPSGDDIAILNIAINAAQAKNVFFRYFSQRIKTCPWFANKFDATTDTFSFPSKSISVYSGHSEREAFEGLNLFFCVLDEISGFALESTTGHEQAKTASSVYKMYRASVSSRFPEYGKIVLLSFPRFLNDFIQQKYNQAVAEKEVVTREHRFKIDPELPDGSEGNEFTIEWEEDKVLRYTDPRTFVLKRPTWEVNPTVDINKLVMDFKSDPIDALSRFACMPPEAENAFFKSRPKIEAAFSGTNLIDNETGRFSPNFKPVEGRRYFIHVDLAQKHDRCAVALSHVEKWVHRTVGTGGYLDEVAPVVKVDFVHWWTPTKTKQVDFVEVRDFIVSIQRSGFNVALTTFDRWSSNDMINYLNQVGMKSDVLSVAKKHYTDMALLVMEERLVGPEIDILIDELLQLQLTNKDKVDHPRRGGKGLSDAVCGAVFNAITHTPREVDQVVEVHTLTSFNKENKVLTPGSDRSTLPIQPPKADMPKDLYQYLSGMRAI